VTFQLLPPTLGVVFARLGLTIAVTLAAVSPVDAQTLQQMLNQQLLGTQLSIPSTQSTQGVEPSQQLYTPPASDLKRLQELSRLEELYSARARRLLRQFGYDVFGMPMPVTATLAGAPQDSYVLGQGDEIVIIFRGQENSSFRVRVDRDGQVIVPRLNPIPAAGRTFGDFRETLEVLTASAFISTRVFVSIGSVRQVAVLVTGDVQTPGQRNLSALNSPIDALLLSGGVKKTGSLRGITLFRGQQAIPLDLYALLARGTFTDVGTLLDGDRIFVAPLGATVAVSGHVRRPGIYELPLGTSSMSSGALIQLAGGIEIAGNYRMDKLRVEKDGRTRLVALGNSAGTIGNGEILFVEPRENIALERIQVKGKVRVAGAIPLGSASSLSKLLRNSDVLADGSYPLLAFVSRINPKTSLRTLTGFSPKLVRDGAQDLPLQNDDLVFLMTRKEARQLAIIAAAKQTKILSLLTDADSPRTSGEAALEATETLRQSQLGSMLGLTGLQAKQREEDDEKNPPTGLAALLAGRSSGDIAEANATLQQPRQLTERELRFGQDLPYEEPMVPPKTPAELAGDLGVTEEALIGVAQDHLVWVLGEVRDPGVYLVAPGTTLAVLFEAAGGLKRNADLSWVEVTSTLTDEGSATSTTARKAYAGSRDDFQRVTALPSDVIRLRPIMSDRDDGSVTVAGQVHYPGNFDITRSEKLSSLLERAGGLTDAAYPYGAIFTRRSSAIAEREGNERAARELTQQVGALATQTGQDSKIAYLQQLVRTLRDAPALGRIMVTADPAILRAKPELDIILEAGDGIYIPKRPSTIVVTGEVLNPGAFQHQTGRKIGDYVELAGGYTAGSDPSRIFIILPDGSARPSRMSWLSFASEGEFIPPGSTIVVPVDPTPFDFMGLVRDVSLVASQVAITAASLRVLTN